MAFFRAFLLGLILFTSQSYSQDFCTITGEVVDSLSGLPVAGVVVTVAPEGESVTTDVDGRFQFRRISAGQITLHFASAFHHQYFRGPQLCREGDRLSVSVSLSPVTIKVASQHVTAKREQFPGLRSYEISSTVTEIASDLGDFLKQQGFHIHSDGRTKYITIRGSTPERVLVLLDGHAINPDGGAVDLASFPTESVERVEVYSSGAAAQFGPNALGGAVNIVSRNTLLDSPHLLKLRGSSGSYGLHEGEVTLSAGRESGMRVLANYQYSEQANDFTYRHPYEGELTRRSNFSRHNSGFVTLSHDRLKGAKFSARLFNNHNGIPGAVFQETEGAAETRRNNQIYNVDYSLRRLRLSLNYRQLEQSFHDPDAFIPYGTKNLQIGREVSLIWSKPGGNGLNLTLGGKYLSQSFFGDDLLKPDRSSSPVRRRTESLFGSVRKSFSLEPLHISGEGRYRIDQFDDETYRSPYIGLSIDYPAIVTIGLEGAYSKSYRYPPIDALFWRSDVFAVANSGLLAETATSREFGLHFSSDAAVRVNGRMIWFDNDLDNLIIWRRRFDGRYQPVNIDRANHSGLETTLSLATRDDTFAASYHTTLLSATNESIDSKYFGNKIPFRPNKSDRLNLTLRYRGLRIDYNYSYTGERFIREANTKKQPGYALHDLMMQLSYRVSSVEQTISVALYNVTDNRYELLERMPMPPRTLSVGIVLKL